jgi:hypothetical protein
VNEIAGLGDGSRVNEIAGLGNGGRMRRFAGLTKGATARERRSPLARMSVAWTPATGLGTILVPVCGDRGSCCVWSGIGE